MKSKKFINICKKIGVNPDNVPELLTLEDCFKATGRKPGIYPDCKKLSEKDKRQVIADYNHKVMVEAFNEGKTPDYSPNNSQRKYEPRFWVQGATKKNSAGSGLSYLGCVRWLSATDVGSCLCFFNENNDIAYARMMFAVVHFIKVYEEAYLAKK